VELISLIPSFGGFAWTIVAFVLALAIIVTVHEYGHYIVGRWTGIHAEVFSLGIGPVLYSRTDKRGTRWQVALLPVGGYVKFMGDTSAASTGHANDLVGLTPEQRRATMHGAPLWARAATVLAGPVFNFILSILVFAGFFLFSGVATDTPTVGALKPTPFVGQSLLPGDKILAIGATPTPDFPSLLAASAALQPAAQADYTVDRGGETLTLQGPFPLPPVADGVQPQSAAIAAGLQAGDMITAVDGTPIFTFTQLRDIVGASDGAALTLSVWRAGDTFEVQLQPKRVDLPLPDGGFETRWLIGLSGGLVFDPETRTPGVVETLRLGVNQTWMIATTSLSGMWHMITGAISSCNLRGPIGIAETSGAAASQGVASFVGFIAMLSTAVGLMNLFPVPILDGGHLVFHAWEAITGKPPHQRVLNAMMMAGLGVILAMMLFALKNDIFCP
jgi:regulator of sigma E protease